MAYITGLEEKNRLVYIYADRRLLCAVDKKTFSHYPLALDEEVEAEEYMDKLFAFQQKRAYELALGLLDTCDRTEKQVLKKLMDKGVVEGAAQAAVERLKESGLVNDEAYAQRMVQLQSQRPVGRFAVKRKLMQRGVDQETAQWALEEMDGLQQKKACMEAASSLARRYRDDPLPVARRKLGQALGRRGFGWDDISAVLEEIFGENEDWNDGDE